MAANQTAKTQPEDKPGKMLGIGAWAALKGTDPAIYAGVCRAQNWADGKQVTEAAYISAVNEFLMGGGKRGAK